MKLYSGPLSMFGAKVEIALREKDLDFQLEMVPFDTQHRYEPKHPEVLRINPKGQVPVFVDGPIVLYDSTQIFEYLEDRYPHPPLWPRTVPGRARARQREHASDEIFFPHVIRLMMLRGHPDPIDSAEWKLARSGIERYYSNVEGLLATSNYLSGDSYTYADIAFFMAQFFAMRHTVPMSDACPRLRAWRAKVGSRPAVKPVIGAMVDYLRATNLPVPDMG